MIGRLMGRRAVLPWVSVLALPVAIVSWTVGMLLTTFELGGFGLIGGLHPLWFVGVATAVVGMLAAIASRQERVLLVAYSIAIAAMITGTGVLLERGPRFHYIFYSYQYSNQVLQTASLDYQQTYLAWPGWHIVLAAAVGASRIDPTVLLTWLPLWLTLVTLAALMTLFRRMRLQRHQQWLAVALALTLFLAPVYPLPTSMGLILLLYAVALLLPEYLATRRSLNARAGLVLLIAALVTTHLLTSLEGLVVVGGASVLAALTFHRRPGWAALLAGVLFAAYLFYVAVQVTAQLLPQQIDLVLNLDRLFGSISGSTAALIGSGSADHVNVVRVRVAYGAVLSALAILGAVTAVLFRKRLRRWVLPTTWIVGGVAGFGVGGYGGEILIRASTAAAPGTLALASWLGRARAGRWILAAAIGLGALLSPINLYGNELFDYVRPSELAADAVLKDRHPVDWTLLRASRTWYAGGGGGADGPYVTVYGPLYDRIWAFISRPQPPRMPYWSYDNGDMRIMVSRDRIQ